MDVGGPLIVEIVGCFRAAVAICHPAVFDDVIEVRQKDICVRVSFKALINSCQRRIIIISGSSRINDQTMRCKIISNAGTARIAFQYIGLIPQIKNAEDAYTTPDIISEWRLDFVFLGLGSVI